MSRNGSPCPSPIPCRRPSATFHEALDKYIEHIQKTAIEPTPDGPQMTAFGHLKVEQARRIKSRQKDRPLSPSTSKAARNSSITGGCAR